VELKHVKELMAAMGRTGTKRLEIKQKDFELVLERATLPLSGTQVRSGDEIEIPDSLSSQAIRTDQALSKGAEMSAAHIAPSSARKASPPENSQSTYVQSPMVGTFYNAPSPESPPFVKVGDRIEKHTVVCIIEAMKVMNEVKANMSGVIAEILAESGQPVEFGSKLFRIVE